MSFKAGGLKAIGFIFFVVGVILLLIGLIAAESYNYNNEQVALWAWILLWIGVFMVVVGAIIAIAGAFVAIDSKNKAYKLKMAEYGYDTLELKA